MPVEVVRVLTPATRNPTPLGSRPVPPPRASSLASSWDITRDGSKSSPACPVPHAGGMTGPTIPGSYGQVDGACRLRATTIRTTRVSTQRTTLPCSSTYKKPTSLSDKEPHSSGVKTRTTSTGIVPCLLLGHKPVTAPSPVQPVRSVKPAG